MPTETQKNFHKQMKELSREVESRKSNEVYSYVNRDFVSTKVSYNKRKIITVSGIIGFLVLGIYVYSFFGSIASSFTARKQGQVVKYLQSMDAIDRSLKPVMDNINKVMTVPHNDNAALKQAVDNLNKCKNDLQIIINNTENISVTNDLQNLKQMELAGFYDIANAIDSYIIGFSTRSTSSINQGNNFLNQYTFDSGQKRTIILTVLDKNKMKYQVQSDGTIRYWYRDRALGAY